MQLYSNPLNRSKLQVERCHNIFHSNSRNHLNRSKPDYLHLKCHNRLNMVELHKQYLKYCKCIMLCKGSNIHLPIIITSHIAVQEYSLLHIPNYLHSHMLMGLILCLLVIDTHQNLNRRSSYLRLILNTLPMNSHLNMLCIRYKLHYKMAHQQWCK